MLLQTTECLIPVKVRIPAGSVENDMNATHLHLMLNHVPVLGIVFGLGLLAFALWRKNDAIQQVALGVFVIAAIAVVPVYLTGEPAEDAVKTLPGVSDPVIEQHEEAAVIGLVGTLALGIVAQAGLVVFRRGRTIPRGFGFCMLLASMVVGGLMVRTASLGGQVRHTEIRPPTGPTAVEDRSRR